MAEIRKIKRIFGRDDNYKKSKITFLFSSMNQQSFVLNINYTIFTHITRKEMNQCLQWSIELTLQTTKNPLCNS